MLAGAVREHTYTNTEMINQFHIHASHAESYAGFGDFRTWNGGGVAWTPDPTYTPGAAGAAGAESSVATAVPSVAVLAVSIEGGDVGPGVA